MCVSIILSGAVCIYCISQPITLANFWIRWLYLYVWMHERARVYVCTGNNFLLRSVLLSTTSHLISCQIGFGGSLRCGKATGGLRITMKLHPNAMLKPHGTALFPLYAVIVGPESVVYIATHYELDGPRIEPARGRFSATCRPALEPTHFLYNGSWISFPRVERPGHGGKHIHL